MTSKQYISKNWIPFIFLMVVWSTAYNSVSPLKIYNKGCVRRFSLLLPLSSIKHNLVRAAVVTGRLIFSPAVIYIWQQGSLLRALQPFMCICGTLESKHDLQNPQNKTGQGSIITKNMTSGLPIGLQVHRCTVDFVAQIERNVWPTWPTWPWLLLL